MKRDIPIYGFLIGALLPVLGAFIVYLILFRSQGFDLGGFLSRLWVSKDIAAKVITLSILINLLPFLIFTRKRMDYLARGVFIATALYAVLIVLLKFVWS